MAVIVSPVPLIVFACAVMWILLEVRPKALSTGRKWAAALFFIAILAGNLYVRARLGGAVYSQYALLLMQLPAFLLFYILSRHKGIKLLFVLLTTVVLSSPVVTVGLLFRELFAPSTAGMFAINIASYIFMGLLVWRFFKPAFNYILEYGKDRVFWLFSLIPLLNYVYGYLRTRYYFIPLEVNPDYLVGRIPTLIVFISYALLLYIFKSTREADRMQNEQQMMAIQLAAAGQRIEELNKHLEQTAAYRHDMRHHFAMLSGYLRSGDTVAAMSYIDAAGQDIETFTPKIYCENGSVNLLLSSFAERARRMGVEFSAEVDIAAVPGLVETELCALLSNGLENALNAAAACGGESERLVRVNCQSHKGNLLILIRNPYDGEVVIKNGLPQSSCAEHGFGVKSIHMIVNKHNGILTFATADGIFTLKAMLPVEA